MEFGYVYILMNPSYPDLVKIGKTTKDPKERMRELSSSTSAPHPFVLVHFENVTDCDAAEREVHEKLEKYRVNKRREFFEIKVLEAIQAVNAVCEKFKKEEVVKNAEVAWVDKYALEQLAKRYDNVKTVNQTNPTTEAKNRDELICEGCGRKIPRFSKGLYYSTCLVCGKVNIHSSK